MFILFSFFFRNIIFCGKAGRGRVTKCSQMYYCTRMLFSLPPSAEGEVPLHLNYSIHGKGGEEGKEGVGSLISFSVNEGVDGMLLFGVLNMNGS